MPAIAVRSTGCFKLPPKKYSCCCLLHFQELVAILPNNEIRYFDVQSKTWKALSSVKKLHATVQCYSAELIGNCLYVAAIRYNCGEHHVFCYDIVNNVWSTLPPIPDSLFIKIVSLCHFEDHLYVTLKSSHVPYRFNLTTNQWQPIASSRGICTLGQGTYSNKAAAVYKSCLYVLCAERDIFGSLGGIILFQSLQSLSALFRFDPKKNCWEQKATTETPHFGSSLFVVDNNLCVAGGRCSIRSSVFVPDGYLAGDPAAIEVYNDQENAWSVVKQTHIPPNNLGAVEIKGRVYFIINSFPVDSGIRIPPGEVYPVVLDGWENLGKVRRDAVLCYVPLKTDNLTTENE